MSQNHQIRRHVTSANPHWARVVDYGLLPLTREEACVTAVGTLQADDDDDIIIMVAKTVNIVNDRNSNYYPIMIQLYSFQAP